MRALTNSGLQRERTKLSFSVWYEAESEAWVSECPELGLMFAGNSEMEAIAAICSAVRLYFLQLGHTVVDNTGRECISMAEEWLKRIADQIKKEDHEAAEQASRTDREQKQIQQHGPTVWRSFTDFLEKYLNDLITDFGQDVTLLEGPISRSLQGQGQIKIQKKAFPYVTFNASPNFANGSVSMTYSKCNPRPLPGQTVNASGIPGRFELTPEGQVILQIDGRGYQNPGEAAKYIIEKLFSL